MKLGVIDIGANNVRLVIWEIYGQGYYRVTDELKETLRLASDSDSEVLNDAKIESLIDTLSRYKSLCRSLHVSKIITVATESLRRALNRDEVKEKVKEATELDIMVLAEESEAFFNFKGVTGSMLIEKSLLVDIGGASTELALVMNNDLVRSASVPAGTVNMTEKFNLSDIVTQCDHKALEEYLKDLFSKVEWLKTEKFRTIVLIGGSARTIGRIDRHKKRYPLSIIHNYMLEDLDITAMYRAMMTKTQPERLKIRGLDKDRADIILAALAIIYELCSVTGTQELRISGKGLREGILYDHLDSEYRRLPNMLDRSVYSILERHDMSVDHAEKVTDLSVSLFHDLSSLHGMSEEYLPVLKTAAMLHDVGMSIRYYDHEKHSFYIILNSDINGLNHREILISALAAQSHRKFDHELSIIQYSHIINKLDSNIAEKMGLLIGIGEAMELSDDRRVSHIDVSITPEEVILTPHSSKPIEHETLDLDKLKSKFALLYRRNLVINPSVR